jgi:2-polyprenyl-3-methyl-5-hydroxy-6-metoxy-1,4-benzoquinol methylase
MRTEQISSSVADSKRAVFSEHLQQVQGVSGRPRILSIGNGRAEEAEALLSSPPEKIRAEFVAFDDNQAGLDFLARKFAASGTVKIGGAVRSLPEQSADLGTFDFIYSGTILERLETEQAQNVVAALVLMLKPGGTLLLANSTPRYEFTDKVRIYRSELDMARLTSKISEHRSAGHAVFCDYPESTVFLEVHSRAAARSRAARA